MLHPTPDTWTALTGFVLLLGLRHGLDADHLAAVDGMARLNAPRSPRLARCCGLLFAGGHGAVVLAVVAAVVAGGGWLQPPAWLDDVGALLSIALLLTLAVVNLQALRRAAPGQLVPLAGLKSRWLGRRLRLGSPWAVLGVGALMALSLDTVAIAAWMGLSAVPRGAPGAGGLLLGACFVGGMVLVDGLHGWWLASVLGRDDARAARVSRWLTACVAVSSLLVAGVMALRWWRPEGAVHSMLPLAMLLIAGTGLVYLAARLMPVQHPVT